MTQLVNHAPAGVRACFEPSPKWVRARFGGETVADSKRVMLLHARGRGIPTYYFPREDVRGDLLIEAEPSGREDGASSYTVRAGDRLAPNAAWSYEEVRPEGLDLRGYVAFDWKAMDAWFEEDEEVFVHARDPYSRIDVAESLRQVEVIVGGEVVADTHRPRLLFETGLPTRYYIPTLDVRMELLTQTATRTSCPYKGDASYWSVTVGGRTYDDIVWSYPHPIPECGRIANLLCFFQERVDAIVVDGDELPRPDTPWS